MIMHFVETASNVIGLVGVGLVLFAYFSLQIGKIQAHKVPFSLCNFTGSIFILVSLAYHWNLASGVIEWAWLAISLYGLIKSTCAYFKKRSAAVATTQS